MTTIRRLLLTAAALTVSIPALAQTPNAATPPPDPNSIQGGFGTAPITFGSPAAPTSVAPPVAPQANVQPTSIPIATTTTVTTTQPVPNSVGAVPQTTAIVGSNLPVPVSATAIAAAAAGPSCANGAKNPAEAIVTAPDLPPSLQKLYANRLPSFEKYDLNCDGFLDQNEIHQMIDDKFRAADTNGDGVIDETEAQNIIGAFEEQASTDPNLIVAPRATALQHRIAIMDTNQDGKITRDEFTTYFLDRYQKLDRNGDGKLDITEYQTDDEENRVVRRPQ